MSRKLVETDSLISRTSEKREEESQKKLCFRINRFVMVQAEIWQNVQEGMRAFSLE